MIRLRLFFLFIAFALLALVRPRKCLEMLEAADNWVRYEHSLKVQARMDSLVRRNEAQQACVDHALKMGTKITERKTPL